MCRCVCFCERETETDFPSQHEQDVYLFAPHSTVIYLHCVFICQCMHVCMHAHADTLSNNEGGPHKKMAYKPWEPVSRAGMQGITLLNPMLLLCDPDRAERGRDLPLNRTGADNVDEHVKWLQSQ